MPPDRYQPHPFHPLLGSEFTQSLFGNLAERRFPGAGSLGAAVLAARLQKAVDRQLMKAKPLLVIVTLALGLSLVACSGPAATPASEAEVECAQSEPHPMAESIAEQYGLSPQQVMVWACDGEEFEDILLALETSKLTGRSVEELLQMKGEIGWDQAWVELGLFEDAPAVQGNP